MDRTVRLIDERYGDLQLRTRFAECFERTVERDVTAIRARPDVGPGRAARMSMMIGFLFGLAVLTAYVVISIKVSEKFEDFNQNFIRGIVPWVCPTGALLLIALLTFAGVTKLWVMRTAWLKISTDGSVRFGSRRLVAPGSAVALRIDRTSRRITGDVAHAEWVYTADVYIARSDGTFAELPRPYYSQLDEWLTADCLAGEMARLLKIPVRHGALPARQSTREKQERLRRVGCFGLPFVTISLPFVIVGTAVMTNGLDNAPLSMSLIFSAMFSGTGSLFFLLGWCLGLRLSLRSGAILLCTIAMAVVTVSMMVR